MAMGVGRHLYRFTLDCAREEVALVHSLYSHKKTRLLNILCTGYEHFHTLLGFIGYNMTVAL